MALERGMVDAEVLGQGFYVFGAGFGLAVKESCDGDFVAADSFGNCFKGDFFGGFGGEEGLRRGG